MPRDIHDLVAEHMKAEAARWKEAEKAVAHRRKGRTREAKAAEERTIAALIRQRKLEAKGKSRNPHKS